MRGVLPPFHIRHYGVVLKYNTSLPVLLVIIISITLPFLFCSQVRCEVVWALMSLNGTTPEGVGENFLSKTKNWDTNPSEGNLLLQDWGVISLFKIYIKEWNVIVNSLNKEKACPKKKKAT